MPKSRVPTGALRLLPAVVLALVVGGGAFAQLMTQLVPTQPQQDASGLPPGTELIYRVTSASHPGPNAGPDARGVAGEGFAIVTVQDWGQAGCVLTMNQYLLHPMDGTLRAAGGEPVLGTMDNCGDVWRSGQSLEDAARTAGQHTTVGRGPLQVNGRTYDVIGINNDPQQGQAYSRNSYDSATGILVFSSRGYGDRTWGGTPTMASQSSVMQLLEVRQLSVPWRAHGQLPASLRGLTGLSYEGRHTMSFPAVTMYDSSVVSQLALQLRLQQATPNWLLFDVQTSVSVPGSQPMTESSTSLIGGGTGHYIPPEVLARLTPGQVLDNVPHLGMQVTVGQDDSGYAVIESRARGYTSYAYYDRTSGLQMAVRTEERNQDTVTLTELWLTAAN